MTRLLTSIPHFLLSLSQKSKPHPFSQPPQLLASISMADGRKPEDGTPQWDPSGGQEPGGTHGANGYSASAFRTCQPGGTHMATAPYTARENGFNGELTGAHAITAGNMALIFPLLTVII